MEQTLKSVNYNTIDQSIFDFEQSTLKTFPKWDTERDYGACEYNQRQMLNALKYYINTGRASLDFLRKFVNLSGKEMNALVRKCWKANDKSITGIVNVIKKHFGMDE